MDKTEDTITCLGLENSSSKIAPIKSVLIVVRSGVLIHTFPVAINVIPLAINQDIKVLIPCSDVIPEYLAYYFKVFNDEVLSRIVKHSTTVQSVNTYELDKLDIPLPPKETQQRIIDIMDKAYKVKNEKEKEANTLLNSINDYISSELNLIIPENDLNTLENRVFYVSSADLIGDRFDPFFNSKMYIKLETELKNKNYDLCNLTSLVHVENGVVYSANDESREGNAILRANNINLRNNTLDLSDIRYINGNIKIPDRKKLYRNDILMCTASGSKDHAGKVAFIEVDMPFFFGGFMSVLRVYNSKCNPQYLFEYLSSKIFRTLIFRHLGGTNINNVGFNILQRIVVILPDQERQEEIVLNIEQIRKNARKLEEEAENVINDAKSLVKRILLGVFNND